LAPRLGVSARQIADWIERDSIPPGYHLKLFLECVNRGLSVDLLFDLSRPGILTT
jgi:hypothetical protein